MDDVLAKAKELLTCFSLSINGQIYELIEVELYLHSAEHPDPFVHRFEEQAMYAKWYFHRTGKKRTYKGGTFKGLDLTLGQTNYHYSWLIRTIYNPRTGTISGPCRVVDHILKCYNVSSIAELVGEEETLSCLNNKRKFILLRLPSPLVDLKLYRGPRVGLNDSKFPEWAKLEYRFVRNIEYVAKEKKKLKLIS